MNLTSPIKISCCILFLLFLVSNNYAQIREVVADSSKNNSNQKSVIFSMDFFQPIPTQESFIGKGTKGRLGFNLGTQVFVYKNFYFGAFIGASYLEVTKPELTGSYRTTRISHSYIQIGYDFPLGKKFRLGLDLTPYGRARYRNIVSNTDNVRQIDHANFSAYGAHLNYKIGSVFYLYLGYSYRNDRTEIKTAPEIQNQFDNINYHNISFGIRIYAGHKDVVSTISDSHKKRL